MVKALRDTRQDCMGFELRLSWLLRRANVGRDRHPIVRAVPATLAAVDFAIVDFIRALTVWVTASLISADAEPPLYAAIASRSKTSPENSFNADVPPPPIGV